MSQALAIEALTIECGGLDKSLLIYLAIRANQHGFCWPKTKTIARDLGTSRETISRHVSNLRKRGLIKTKFVARYNIYAVTLGSQLGVTPGSQPSKGSVKDQFLKDNTNVLPFNASAKESGDQSLGSADLKTPKPKNLLMQEILAQTKAHPKTVPELVSRVSKPPTVGNVELFWRHAIRLQYPNTKFAQLRGKEIGYLKRIIKEYGKGTYKRLGYAVLNWSLLVNYANHMDGTKSEPALPNLGFLVGHLNALSTHYEDPTTVKELGGWKKLPDDHEAT